MNKITELRNPESRGIDKKTVGEILEVINKEDAKISKAIHEQLPQIEEAVNAIIETMKTGGSLYLVGAGSSGRLCVLEASEIPPTFGLPSDRIKAVIAGGVEAIYTSVEAAEDDAKNGASEMKQLGVSESDLVIGVAASGSTPYVIGAVKAARELGAKTVGLSCNPETKLSKYVDIAIEVVVGPEVVAGSTRMKAGTSQKMVLNMLTTSAMMKLGLVYDGYMVGVQATNEKLKERSKRIVVDITGVSLVEAGKTLEVSGWDVRVASLVLLTDLGPEEAELELKTRTMRQIIGGRDL